ncbi:hypothetical protein [Mycobacterium sp.]|uniref:hypothetical protein n=1 Tax=Mycobacterium sp. TaxID=1785 RepID=UPI0033423335
MTTWRSRYGKDPAQITETLDYLETVEPLSMGRRRAIDGGRRGQERDLRRRHAYSTYVRGVIVDGDRGVLLTGSGDSAPVIKG